MKKDVHLNNIFVKITKKLEYNPNRVVAQFSKDINPKIDVRQLLSICENEMA